MHIEWSKAVVCPISCHVVFWSKAHLRLRYGGHTGQYWDQQLVDLIQFGFPLDFNREYPLQSTMDNHTSANHHIGEVEKYSSTELQHKALIGPFSEPPFPIHVSPLMTRPKQDSANRRTIVDLIWSKHFSVNAGISKHKYFDSYFELQYPSVDHILMH